MHNRLTMRQVDALKEGQIGDGGNLWLVANGGSKLWFFRFTSPVTGKKREMSIGPSHTVSLALARKKAAEHRLQLLEGLDPIRQRQAARAEIKRQAGLTFAQVAEQYIAEQEPGWRDKRAAPVWRTSIERLANPHIGRIPVREIDTASVLSVLRPIWAEKTETASRVRGRIERILDYARTHDWREGENPARWKGHLSAILPAPAKVATVKHHAAIDRKDIGRVMAELAATNTVGALVVRFICLTVARSGEARAAVWSEIDLEARVWTIPGHKMKAGKEHRVPLSDGALAVLEAAKPLRDPKRGDFVFPGARLGKAMTDVAISTALHKAAATKGVTIHGLRSTFRDWVAEETDYPREVAEMALAHAIGDRVEAAYRRGDLFEKRREMMGEWDRVAQP